MLQLMSDDYKKNADSNAFLKRIEFPSRGVIYDRTGKLMVYNQPAYDIMVVIKLSRSLLKAHMGASDQVSAQKKMNIRPE